MPDFTKVMILYPSDTGSSGASECQSLSMRGRLSQKKHDVGHVVMNCSEKTIRLTEAVIYTDKDHFQELGPQGPTSLPPESLGERQWLYVCGHEDKYASIEVARSIDEAVALTAALSSADGGISTLLSDDDLMSIAKEYDATQKPNGRPWAKSGNGFRSAWGEAAKSAGVEGVTFHDLRGTFATRRMAAGWTAEDVALCTGHSLRDLRTLERYVDRRLVAEQRAEAMALRLAQSEA